MAHRTRSASRSNIELHLEAGALVVFQPDFALYPTLSFDAKGSPRSVTTPLLHGERLENIAITGQGVFDGSGEAWRMIKKSKMTDAQWKQLVATTNSVTDGETWYPSQQARNARRPNLLKLTNCRRILLEGVTFQNSPGWNLNPTLCEDLTIRNVNVKNEWWAQNGDGLDIENCRNVVVRGSRLDVGDDGICLKSGANEEGRRLATPTENILIEDCTVYHAHGGVTIGSEMSSGVRNVRVNNCLFLGTDLGLRFKSTRGRGGIVEKIYISNVRMENIATDAIGFNMSYGGLSPVDEDSMGAANEGPAVVAGVGTPQFRDIYIQDVICRGAATAVALQGLPEMPIRGIHLRNVSISAERGVALLDAQDITFDPVEIQNAGGPVMTLAGSRYISIDGLVYPSGAGAVFQAQGARNANITVAHT